MWREGVARASAKHPTIRAGIWSVSTPSALPVDGTLAQRTAYCTAAWTAAHLSRV